ncbi:hypothetical protein [Chryseobacterium scophthalmum]|uniref:hypothetical protein n=1 Tax=Chryseobacterium scophthalmum TaxID=59733 RepID=UPI001AEBD889|nr:hypothetical protein [Chryseobacterium scophthalmum]
MKQIKYYKTTYSPELRLSHPDSIYIDEYNDALVGLTSRGLTVYNYLHMLHIICYEHNPIIENLNDDEWNKHCEKCAKQLKIEEEFRNFIYGDRAPIVINDFNFLFETYFEIPDNSWFDLTYT